MENSRNKILLVFGVLIMSLFFTKTNASAQNTQNSTPVFKIGDTHFAMFGEFEYGADVTKKSTSFISPGMDLIPLFQQGNFFFESGFGINFEDPANPIEVGPMNVSYRLPNGIRIRAGHWDALPIGRFPRIYDPPWINPLATGPAGFDNFGDLSDFGIQVQGAGYLGDMQVRTFVSLTNGFELSTDPGSAGLLDEGSLEDNNKAKMIGGRVSLSPFFSSNFEIGVSDYYTSNVGDPGSNYDGIGANLFAIDINVAPTVQSLQGFIRVRGQLNAVHVDKATYFDTNLNPYTFNNNSTAWYGMVAYQPSLIASNFLKNIMLAYMISHVNTPKNSQWDEIGTGTQHDLGLTYWFNWRTNLKFDYDIQENSTNTLMIRVGAQL